MKHLARLAALLALLPALALGQISTGPGIVGGLVVGAQVVGGTANRVMFVDASGNLAGDADMTFLTDTLTVTKIVGSTSITNSALTSGRLVFSGTAGIQTDSANLTFNPTGSLLTLGANTVVSVYAAKQLMISGDGTGATTNAGLILGNYASNNGGIWGTTAAPSATNYGIVIGATDLTLNSPDGTGTGVINFRAGNSALKMSLSSTAGAGPAITAGTAASANTRALEVTSTRNYSATATDYEKHSYTLTSTHASDNIFAYYGGAGGVTSLLTLSTAGTLAAAGAITAGTTISSSTTITSGTDFQAASASFFYWNSRSRLSAPADGTVRIGNVAGDGTGISLQLYSDTNLSRISAGVTGVGTGAAGSVAGTLQAAVVTAPSHTAVTSIDSSATANLVLKYNSVATLTVGAANTPVTIAGLTTGTNADTLCLSAGGVILIQAAACTISSLRFKENVSYFDEDALHTLNRLTPIAFNMIGKNADENYARRQIGLSAENVAMVDPRLAIYEPDGVTPKSYRQESLIALTIKGVQELAERVARLEAANDRSYFLQATQ